MKITLTGAGLDMVRDLQKNFTPQEAQTPPADKPGPAPVPEAEQPKDAETAEKVEVPKPEEPRKDEGKKEAETRLPLGMGRKGSSPQYVGDVKVVAMAVQARAMKDGWASEDLVAMTLISKCTCISKLGAVSLLSKMSKAGWLERESREDDTYLRVSQQAKDQLETTLKTTSKKGKSMEPGPRTRLSFEERIRTVAWVNTDGDTPEEKLEFDGFSRHATYVLIKIFGVSAVQHAQSLFDRAVENGLIEDGHWTRDLSKYGLADDEGDGDQGDEGDEGDGDEGGSGDDDGGGGEDNDRGREAAGDVETDDEITLEDIQIVCKNALWLKRTIKAGVKLHNIPKKHHESIREALRLMYDVPIGDLPTTIGTLLSIFSSAEEVE